MQAFIDSGFRGADLKYLNIVRKYVQAISLADIATIDGHRISHKASESLASNGLCNNTDWPKAIPVIPAAFIILWKKAITKAFINSNSNFGTPCRMNFGVYLGNWIDPVAQDNWQWWRSFGG